jgi:hypothetical protein
MIFSVLTCAQNSVEEAIHPETGTKPANRPDTKYMLYDQFTFDCSRFETKSLQDAFIPIPIRALQIFQQFSSLVNESAQASPVRNVTFKFAEVVPYIAYLKG